MASLGKDKNPSPTWDRRQTRSAGDAVHLSTILIHLTEYEEAVTVPKPLIKEQPESALGNYYLQGVRPDEAV